MSENLGENPNNDERNGKEKKSFSSALPAIAIIEAVIIAALIICICLMAAKNNKAALQTLKAENSETTSLTEASETVSESQTESDAEPTTTEETTPESTEQATTAEEKPQRAKIKIETETGEAQVGIEDGQLKFADVKGNLHSTGYHEDWPHNDYEIEAFKKDGQLMAYDSEKYDYRLGIDIFGDHEEIDWEAVKADGYDFVIMRLAYRGYIVPSIVQDGQVYNYVKGASEAGLDIGVYFFSQAVDEEEAIEEAEYCLWFLEAVQKGPEDIKLGIIFDPESIDDEEARTNDVSGEQFTSNAIAFCDRVKEAGFNSMIYSNMLWEAEKWDMNKLAGYDFWYADYYDKPQTPYSFSIWQYGHGEVAGVSKTVDMNIQLIPKN